jgi:hypothetical protein
MMKVKFRELWDLPKATWLVSGRKETNSSSLYLQDQFLVPALRPKGNLPAVGQSAEGASDWHGLWKARWHWTGFRRGWEEEFGGS